MSGQFGFLKSLGATDEAVAVLNDQPHVFVTLILVIIGLAIQCLFIWYIHFATMKPEQKKARENRDRFAWLRKAIGRAEAAKAGYGNGNPRR
jgi:uncharacterized membrane protein (DUF106 family)